MWFKWMYKNIVADRLVESVCEFPDLFGKLDQALWKDWLKNLRKYWHVSDGKGFIVNL